MEFGIDLRRNARHIRVAVVHSREHVFDVLFDRCRCNAMFFVIRDLLNTAALGFLQGAIHGSGDLIGIHNHAPLHIAGRAANRLDKRRFRAQEALFIRIQNRHQSAFGDIKPFAQQVNPDQHVKGPKAQIPQNFDPLNRINIRMHIAHANALFVQIFGQILGHPFG